MGACHFCLFVLQRSLLIKNVIIAPLCTLKAVNSQTIKLCTETELTLTMSQSVLYIVSKQSIPRQIKLCEGTELTLKKQN